MPDLTFHAARWCASNEYLVEEVTGGDVYFITFNKGQWSCTCKCFKFKGYCKHIDQVYGSKCNYGKTAALGSPKPHDVWIIKEGEYTCPRCGGPTRIMSFAA